ncbi:MAG: O-antigen ligase family protein [Parcubacteria group bacterium]|jgi:O-antigen ligase
MDKLIFFLALYLPFQIALNPTAGVDLASIRVLVLVIFLLWLAQGLKNKKLIIKNNLQSGLVCTFLFLNTLSVLMARNTDWSARKLLFLFSLFPVYFVVAGAINTREKAVKIIKALVGSGAIVALVGIVQFLSQFVIGLERTYKFWANYVIAPFLGSSVTEAVLNNPSWLVNIASKTYLRATATFPDPHMLAFYLGLLIPLALGLVLREGKERLFWTASLGLLVVADLLTFSRGGYLGLSAGISLLVILSWNRLGRKYKISAIVLVCLTAIVLLIPNPVSQRFYSSFNFKEGSNQGRIATWQQAAGVIEDNPLMGVGIGNYPLAIKASADYREPIYAHNTYLDIAAETGSLNALVWIGLLVVVWIKFYLKGRKDPLFLMAGVSIAIFAAHSLVETAIYSPTVLVLFLIIISLSNIDEKVA